MRLKIWKISVAIGAVFALLAGGHTLQDHSFAVKKVPTSHKAIALTFDDGPHPHTTLALLKTLEAKQARATFFLHGQNADKFPPLVGALAAAGQEVPRPGYPPRLPQPPTPGDTEPSPVPGRDPHAHRGPGPMGSPGPGCRAAVRSCHATGLSPARRIQQTTPMTMGHKTLRTGTDRPPVMNPNGAGGLLLSTLHQP